MELDYLKVSGTDGKVTIGGQDYLCVRADVAYSLNAVPCCRMHVSASYLDEQPQYGPTDIQSIYELMGRFSLNDDVELSFNFKITLSDPDSNEVSNDTFTGPITIFRGKLKSVVPNWYGTEVAIVLTAAHPLTELQYVSPPIRDLQAGRFHDWSASMTFEDFPKIIPYALGPSDIAAAKADLWGGRLKSDVRAILGLEGKTTSALDESDQTDSSHPLQLKLGDSAVQAILNARRRLLTGPAERTLFDSLVDALTGTRAAISPTIDGYRVIAFEPMLKQESDLRLAKGLVKPLQLPLHFVTNLPYGTDFIEGASFFEPFDTTDKNNTDVEKTVISPTDQGFTASAWVPPALQFNSAAMLYTAKTSGLSGRALFSGYGRPESESSISLSAKYNEFLQSEDLVRGLSADAVYNTFARRRAILKCPPIFNLSPGSRLTYEMYRSQDEPYLMHGAAMCITLSINPGQNRMYSWILAGFSRTDDENNEYGLTENTYYSRTCLNAP